MTELEPDYQHYAKCGKLTLVEFSLILHRINPELYDEEARTSALMFVANENGQFLEPRVTTPMLFQKALQSAYKTYNRLKRVDWSTKYRKKTFALHGWPINWLVSETVEQELTIPEEFLSHYSFSNPSLSDKTKKTAITHNKQGKVIPPKKTQQGTHFSVKRKLILKHAIGG